VPLVRFRVRDDGACDGHKMEKQGGCRFARCGTCKRLPSEGSCECEHTCECFACWEYKDNIDRVVMSQGCRVGICWICFEDESDLEYSCDCKWLCECEYCVVSRKDGNQGCPHCECVTCGGNPGDVDSFCDCENTCQCHECRGGREEYDSGVLSGEIIPPRYEENEGCIFSACCSCDGTMDECVEGDCVWRCRCRFCRQARREELQVEKDMR